MDLDADSVDEDFLFEPAPSAVPAVRKFQPNAKAVKPVRAHPKTGKPVQAHSKARDVASQLVPPITETPVPTDTKTSDEKSSPAVATIDIFFVDASALDCTSGSARQLEVFHSEPCISGVNEDTALSNKAQAEGTTDLDTNSPVEVVVLPAAHDVQTLDNFLPKPHAKTVKSVEARAPSNSPVVATQLIPPITEPPVCMSNLKSPDEKLSFPITTNDDPLLNASDLNSAHGFVGQPVSFPSEPLGSRGNEDTSQCDRGVGEGAMDLGADYVDEDFLFQPAPAAVRAVPKFQPKTFSKSVKPVKGHPKTRKPVEAPSKVPVVASRLVPPVLEAPVHISDTMNTDEKPSLQIASTNDSMVDASGLDSTHGSSCHAEVFPSETLISGGNVDTARSDHGEGEGAMDLNADSLVGKERTSDLSKDINNDTEKILNEKSTSKVVEDEGASKSTRKLRKRVRKSTPDKIHENQELDNSNIREVEGIHSDDGCGGEEVPKQKRACRTSKKPVTETEKPPKQKRSRRTSEKPVTETEKPTRKRKKASDELGSAEQEPVKKFPHDTRRRRRQVNKELLTPEKDINRSQLCIRDLIRTYEAKERISKKEVSAGGNSSFNQRDNHFGANGEFWGQEDAFENYDVQFNVTTTKWNHHSFRKNPTSISKWSKAETDLFYQALRQFGTNFEMIQKLFPGRTRHQMTLKFKNERRKYPLQIADATTYPSKDFSLVKLVIQALADEEKEKAKKAVYYVNVNNDEDEYEEGNEQPEKEEEAANDLEGEFDKEEQEANEGEGGGDKEEQDVSESHNQFEYEDTQWDGNASYYQDTETDEFSFLL